MKSLKVENVDDVNDDTDYVVATAANASDDDDDVEGGLTLLCNGCQS